MALISLAEPASRKFTSIRQLELLVEFVEAHKQLAFGNVKNKEARAMASRLWAQCATICNAEGASRNAKGWSRYWNDIKGRVKTKLRSLSKTLNGTAGGSVADIVMTPIEDRVARILSRGYQQIQFQSQEAATEEASPEPSEEHMVKSEMSDVDIVQEISISIEEQDTTSPLQSKSIVSIDEPTAVPSTSAQPEDPLTETQDLDSEPTTRGPTRRRSLLSHHAESDTEELRNLLLRIEDSKIRVEEKRLKVEERRTEALKEIALAINKVAGALSAIGSSSLISQGSRKRRRADTSDSDI